jgi:hypothetical protein
VSPEGISAEPVERLCKTIAERLSAEGWTLLEQESFGTPGVGAFAVPLSGDFAAMFVVVTELVENKSGEPMISAIGLMGLDYEPARRITTALTGRARSGVMLEQPSLAIALPDADRSGEAADAPVRFAIEQASSLTGLANIDGVIEMLRQGSTGSADDPITFLDEKRAANSRFAREIPNFIPELVAALLAGAGRYEEARDALTECGQTGPEDESREHARFVRQLTRWVEHGGKLALPTTPAQWPANWRASMRGVSAPTSFGQFLSENGPAMHARREAVRIVSAGKSREELRAMLRGELRSREASMRPVALEQTVEMLATEQEPFGKARVALRGLKELWNTRQSQTSRPFTDRPNVAPEHQAKPAWLRAPERAAYPMLLHGGDRVAVQLDPETSTWIGGAMSSDDTSVARLEVWLSANDEPPRSVSRLSVHIGSRRLGELDPAATDRFRPALEAAAERDEDPWTNAHLNRILGKANYVLEVPLPEVRDEP